MRIISKFNDYYDSALAYGMDPGLVYRRETSAKPTPEAWYKKLDEVLFAGQLSFRWHLDNTLPRLHLLGFCGRGYRLFLPSSTLLDAAELGANSTQKLRISNAAVRALLLERAAESRMSAKYSRSAISYIEKRLDEIFKEVTAPVDLPEDWFQTVGAPIFLTRINERWERMRSDETLLNPRLATIGFEKEVDSFTAFQEIAMFLGSQLAPEDSAPRTVGDDRVIAASKGFDEQSFRTAAPGKKKENRKLNRARKRRDD